jgi:hypothetical protein
VPSVYTFLILRVVTSVLNAISNTDSFSDNFSVRHLSPGSVNHLAHLFSVYTYFTAGLKFIPVRPSDHHQAKNIPFTTQIWLSSEENLIQKSGKKHFNFPQNVDQSFISELNQQQ